MLNFETSNSRNFLIFMFVFLYLFIIRKDESALYTELCFKKKNQRDPSLIYVNFLFIKVYGHLIF